MNDQLILHKRIAVIGAGPAGLTLARLLQQRGASVTVYERDLNRDVRDQGATLDLHEDAGLKALRAAGLMDAFRANFRPGAEKLRIVDHRADIILDEHISSGEPVGQEAARPEIDRGPLRNLLLDSLNPQTVVWNRHLQALTPDGDGWHLRFQDGITARADLVIAADGANSKVRHLLTPIRAVYSGYTLVEGLVYHSETAAPGVHKLLQGGKIFAFGDSKTIIVSSKAGGHLAFYAGFRCDEQWFQAAGVDFTDKAQVMRWFQRAFSGWDAVWLELFAGSTSPFVPRPQYYMPLDQTWEARPNLTMVGDAAHVMPPYAGEGVNHAMLDALELSECLSNPAFVDIRQAIAHYERQMLIRAAETTRLTLTQTDLLHSPVAIANMMAVISGADAPPN